MPKKGKSLPLSATPGDWPLKAMGDKENMLNDLVKGLLTELTKISKSDAVVGDVRDAGKAKVVPLCKVSVGFGTAGGEVGGRASADADSRGGAFEGGAAGGALMVEPKAFVVVGEDGIPHMLAVGKGKAAQLRRGVALSQASSASAPAQPEAAAEEEAAGSRSLPAPKPSGTFSPAAKKTAAKKK